MPDDVVKKEPEAGDAEASPAQGGRVEDHLGVSRERETPSAQGLDEGVNPEPVTGAGCDLDATSAEEEADDGFMSAKDAKLAEANERYVRLAADFDNYRKRAQRECQELAAGAGEALVKEFLPVLDNLERALAACAAARIDDGSPHAAAVGSVATGVDLTLRQMKAALAKQGVERMNVKGEVFDPHRHEVLMQEERSDVAANTVTEELEAGYTMRGRVLRPAKVKVAKAPEKAS